MSQQEVLEIIKELGGEATGNEINEHIDVCRQSMYNNLRGLILGDEVIKTRDGKKFIYKLNNGR